MKSLTALLAVSLCAATVFAGSSVRSYRFPPRAVEHGVSFADAQGAHWTHLDLGCPTEMPACEMRVNDHGGYMTRLHETHNENRENGPADVAFAKKDANTLRARCLTAGCSLKVGEKISNRIDVPLGTEIEVRVDEAAAQ